MDKLDIGAYAQAEQNADEYIDFYGFFSDWLNVCLNCWWIIVLAVSLSSTAGFFLGKVLYTPRYQTSASFIVDISSAISFDNNSKYQNTMEQISKTFPKLVKTSAFEKMVLAELDIDKFPDDLFIYVSALNDTSLITIYIYSESPQFAYDTLQAVLKCYPRISGYVLGSINMRMIDNDGLPTEPINEKNLRLYALYAAILALLSCFLVAAVFVSMKKTIRSEADFQSLFNINCYGSIPWVRLKNSSNIENIPILFNSKTAGFGFNEAIRTIRTRLERDHAETGASVYLVSSAIPGEGKTTVSVNLALALAESGKKVLLIDFDIRNPSIIKTLKRERTDFNYYEIFENKTSFEDVLVKDIHENLSVLSADKTDRKAAEVFNHPGVRKLFDKAKKDVEYIIVDTAPSSLLSDAAALADYVDAGIYIVCQDYAPIDRIKDGIEMLTEGGLRISGCILNMAEKKVVGHDYIGYSYETEKVKQNDS